MKIDKQNPKHWLILLLTGVYTVFAIIFRTFYKKQSAKSVIFYGHKFNGNLRSFYNYLNDNHRDYQTYYLTMDKTHGRQLAHNVKVLYTTSFRDMMKVAKSSAIITSHGSHALVFLNKFSDMKFIDVWHGVSYKGWGKDSFGEQKEYDEVWVSSPAMKKVYIDKYGFKPNIVKVTGYSRIDQLVNGDIDRSEVVKKYNIPPANKYILIAVTWKQDDAGRSIIPFGLSESEFFSALEQTGAKNKAHIIFRTHLNSSDLKLDNAKNLKHLHFMPYHEFEVTEDFLAMADILITDWSSIAFDYLPLKRPTIYLDVDPPFKAGFAIGPEHRFGPVVGDVSELTEAIDRYINNPRKYQNDYKKEIASASKIGYDWTLDGKSSERYYERLKSLIG